ncbi:MAG: prepilin-type N-terminal cleavage/methylation domain-containing protein [Lysobacter sp.]|nr:prepilin-type N-terminal cleavage/methylation domain-containing protein [Lysobacter sp.]MDQ3205836.1 prepilin-type N-terminal cleavage/methylation domain-containing protein [Pseudomonadota bacterium]
MLMHPRKRSQAGVTLVELMVAMVVGLIVIGAAIALIVSLMKSNNDSIRSMRLSQEMRAVSDIITMEVRRARSLVDPLSNVGQGAAAFVTCNAIDVATAGCVTFAYGCDPTAPSGTFRTISLSNSSVLLATDAAAAPACGTGQPLSSTDLVVDSLVFTQTAQGAIQMSLQAHPGTDTTMTRQLTRVIWPRSAPVIP